MTENFGYVIATRYLVENKRPVMFMYREEAEGTDSGWRFFAGDEDQAYVDDPENLGIYDIKTILELSPDVEMYLHMPAGTALEREDAADAFDTIHDWTFAPEEV